MVVVVAKFKAQKGKEEEVEKQLRMLVEYVRNEEPGTMTYVCHRAKDDPRTFLFFERYVNEEALEKHSASTRFQQIFNRVTPLLAGAPVVDLYEEVAGKR